MGVFGLWFVQRFVNQTNRKMKFLDKLPESVQTIIAIVGFGILLYGLVALIYAVS